MSREAGKKTVLLEILAFWLLVFALACLAYILGMAMAISHWYEDMPMGQTMVIDEEFDQRATRLSLIAAIGVACLVTAIVTCIVVFRSHARVPSSER